VTPVVDHARSRTDVDPDHCEHTPYPLLELKDPRGELVWVDAKQIRAYRAYRAE